MKCPTPPSTSFWILWATLLYAAMGVGCRTPLTGPDPALTRLDPAPGSQQECIPSFPDRDGWSGGDAAYSVPLPTFASSKGAKGAGQIESGEAGTPRAEQGRKSLWLFGDSFFGSGRERSSGRSYPFVHNTIAVSTCDEDGDWTVEYFAGRGPDGEIRDFIRPDPEADWVQRTQAEGPTGDAPYYWLFDAFYAHDALFIGLLRIGTGKPRGDFQLPFRLLGVDLARIENFRETPSRWKIRLTTLSDDLELFPASGFVVLDQELHAFAFIDRGDDRSPRTLTRLDLRALAQWRPDVGSELETLGHDGTWIRRGSSREARILMDDDATEMSIDFDSAARMWFAVYSRLPEAHSSEESGNIWIRFADRLEGDWSRPRAFYQVPESLPGRARDENEGDENDEKVFCYAGKAHPQFGGPRRLVVTYVCNLFAQDPDETLETLDELIRRTDLYRPRAVSLPMPRPASKPEPIR